MVEVLFKQVLLLFFSRDMRWWSTKHTQRHRQLWRTWMDRTCLGKKLTSTGLLSGVPESTKTKGSCALLSVQCGGQCDLFADSSVIPQFTVTNQLERNQKFWNFCSRSFCCNKTLKFSKIASVLNVFFLPFSRKRRSKRSPSPENRRRR